MGLLSERGFLIVLWVCVAQSLLLVILRLATRIWTLKRLYSDDAFVVLSWLLLLVVGITWQIYTRDMYLLQGVLDGRSLDLGGMDDLEYVAKFTTDFLRAALAVSLIYLTGIWAIKFAFLMFFRRLGRHVRHQNVLWWTVFLITAATYVSVIGNMEYKCMTSDFWWTATHCHTDAQAYRNNIQLIYACVADVATDAMILALPIHLLWGVRIDSRRKAALGGIFSLVVITATVAIIRTTQNRGIKMFVDPSWLYTWSVVEHSVAITVACLGSFNTLFFRRSASSMRMSSGQMYHGSDNTGSNASGATKEVSAIDSIALSEEPLPSLPPLAHPTWPLPTQSVDSSIRNEDSITPSSSNAV